MTIDGCPVAGLTRTVPSMDTRTLGYVGLGVLVGVVVATLIGIPPIIWIAAALLALVVTVAVIMARSDGTSDAARMLGLAPSDPAPANEPPPTDPSRPSAVEMELVREGDGETPAVWLHRSGGRRVHRFATPDGWVVQQVSTKDPDNPKKRVIGQTLTLATESQAIEAADDLAQGVRRSSVRADALVGSPLVAETFA